MKTLSIQGVTIKRTVSEGYPVVIISGANFSLEASATNPITTDRLMSVGMGLEAAVSIVGVVTYES